MPNPSQPYQPVMQANHSTQPSKPSRKPHKKAKTGCRTCRIRRVKCDEQRPNCLKCASTGRVCDGYAQVHVESKCHVLDYAYMKSVRPVKALAMLPDLGDDIHYLQFYYRCVGPKLSGRFDTEFWSHTIMQMAHAEHAVRSALIALGHLNQHQSGTLQHARRSTLRTKQYDCKPFWVNYNKAIRQLVEHIAKPKFSAEVALVVSLLFACIEFLQADADVAFTHVRNGLNIVYELRQRESATSTAYSGATGRSSHVGIHSNMIEQVLVPVLTQALASALPYGPSLAKDIVFLDTCPQYFAGNDFTDIADARSSLFDLRNAALMLARDTATKLSGSQPFTASDHQRQHNILGRHFVWLRAFEAFECSQVAKETDPVAISILRLGYCASYSACACIMDKTQLSYDTHIDSFRSLVRHAAAIINSMPLDTPAPTANFTFDTSVVPALFYTAIRCRCPATRREAIGLLAKNLPREGLWDPEQHRIVAERVVEIEELEVDVNGWPTETSRLCRSAVGMEIDANNGFQASFLYAKDLALAAQNTWTERLTFVANPGRHALNASAQ